MSKSVRKPKSFISLLIMTVMILSMSIPVMGAQAADITDIGDHWAKNEISAWVSQGLILGYNDDTFKPNNSITRAEFIALVNRVFGFSEKASVPFTDVKESDWFYTDFAKASKVGYLVGYEGGKVGPNGFITRQEVASIAAKVKSLQEDATGANIFADAAAIPALYKGAVGAIANAQIMNGYKDLKFEPAKGITRAESVITLNRLMNLKNTVKIEAITDKSLSVRDTYNVELKLLTTDAKVSVQSSDASVASATLNGSSIQLKGLKVGTATITVTGKKDGMLDGIVTFKVTVGPVVSGGGGGSHSSSSGGSGGGPKPPKPPKPPVEDDSKLQYVQAMGTTATAVTGNYADGVTKVEVLYSGLVKEAALEDGEFSWSIFPGLENGTSVTVKGYVGSKLVDTDVVKVGVAAERPYLSDVKAVGTTATKVSGKCAPTVTKVEVLYNGLVKEAEIEDGEFYWSIFPGLDSGTTVTVKAYVGTALKATKTVTTAGEPSEEDYISEVKAVGTTATKVSGKCVSTVTKVEVLYSGLVKEAEIEDGEFYWSIFPGLDSGTTVTVKAYVGAALKETVTVTTAGEPSEEDYISDVKAVGTTATKVSGKYTPTVTKVEVLYSGLVKEAEIEDGEFYWSIFPGLDSGTTVTVKAYVGTALKETVTVNVQ